MSFPAYPTYRDSGVAWIGAIPSSWSVIPLRRAVSLVTDRASGQTRPVALENIEGWTGKFIETNTVYDGVGTTFDVGDVLFGKLRPYLAKAWLATHPGEAVGDFHVFRKMAGVTGAFIQRLLLSSEVISLINGATQGAKMPRAGWNIMGSILIPIPTITEQNNIVRFLNLETKKIDRIVAKVDHLMKLLEERRQAAISHAVTRGLRSRTTMKESGIAWMGQIPQHWSVKRLKKVALVQGGVAKGRDLGSRKTIMVPYLRVANVQDGYIDLTEIASIEIGEDELQRYLLQPGDVLLNEGGDFDKLGRGQVWNGAISPCIHQNHVFAVRPHSIEPEWLALISTSAYGRHFFKMRANQSTNLASISSSNLRELPVICPPAEERATIIQAVSERNAATEAVVSALRRYREMLCERRSALISAAVTGKIDVRGSAKVMSSAQAEAA